LTALLLGLRALLLGLRALLLGLRALRLRLLLRLICRDGGEGHGCCGCNDEMTYLHTNSFSK
jgi:hypothetical protein